MSRFPSGVVIVTAQDSRGKPWGFTASSFASVSLDPPLVLVCLSKAADCHPTFKEVSWFAINMLSAADSATAAIFATRGADKFASRSFDVDERGSPLLPSAVATLTCQAFETHDCGDHSVIIGRVTAARLGAEHHPMVYTGRRFGRFVTDTPPGESVLTAQQPNPARDVSAHCVAVGDEPVRYCFRCGSAVAIRVPEGGKVSRPVCRSCGNVHYINPTVVVGCVAEAPDGKILLCRRRIGPRSGYWTFPSGFLECGESAEEGARREALEEAQARVRIDGLLCVIDVPQMSEVHLVYRGALTAPDLSVTAESSEVTLMAEPDVPWQHLAFTSIGASLRHYFDDRRSGRWLVHQFDLRLAPESDNRDCGPRVASDIPPTP